jgi:hypothetical protein
MLVAHIGRVMEETHVSWQMTTVAEAIKRLTVARYPSLPMRKMARSRATKIGILYAYGHMNSPQIVAWIQTGDKTALQRLRRESNVVNRFEAWLTKNRPVDIWRLATTWTFYEQWLMYECHPNWLATMRMRFPQDVFLDQLLAQSQGWIVWWFQLEALIFSAVDDLDRVHELAKSWVLHPADTPALLDGMLLPNGASLLSALNERSFKTRDGVVIVRGRPNMYVISRIHGLCSEHVDEPRS